MQNIAKLADVPPGHKKLVRINELDVVMINDWGKFFACENCCPHQGSPMLGGVVRNGIISCPRHGWRYDLASGACLDHPEVVLNVYPVRRMPCKK
jgi:nitrite reductase/ring-hydroxylating ferredoxin subunit